MNRLVKDLESDWHGYTEEYPNWRNSFIEAAMIGFGLGITIALVTVVACGTLF